MTITIPPCTIVVLLAFSCGIFTTLAVFDWRRFHRHFVVNGLMAVFIGAVTVILIHG